MTETIAILTLALLLIVQAVERYYFAKDMTRKLQDCIKAVMSRNINEYIAATKEPEKSKPGREPENDQVELSQLSDEEFDKVLSKI